MKITMTMVAAIATLNCWAQGPTGTPPPATAAPTLPSVKNQSEFAWYRGGNQFGGPAGGNNIFGTTFNSPIYMQTNGGNRITLTHLPFGAPLQQYAGSLPNPAFGTNLTRVGISRDGNQPITRPYSLLHLGYDQPIAAGGITPLGHRSWQDIGTMYMAWTDNFYVGLRQKSPTDLTGRTSVVTANPTDYQDAVISWGDNSVSQNGANPILTGLSFLFHAPLNNPANGGYAGTDYGREVMRMTGDGQVGIGPVFFDNSGPQSDLHINQPGNSQSWMQISNQANQTPAYSAFRGLRMGIDGQSNAYLYNQENRHLIFGTNLSTGNLTRERMRITALGTPGTPNPGNLPANRTRVAISHDPTNPVTQPLSLLHLGYNTGAGFPFPITDGWRPWMDIGMFTSNGTDHVYLGLKQEGQADRQDAILSWGDNASSGIPVGNGPDNFRFIFSATTTGITGTPPANGANGLEGIRLTPTPANGVYTGVGGDPSTNLYWAGNTNPTAQLEVNAWNGNPLTPGGASGLRFTDLNTTTPPVVNPGLGVLAVNTSGDVIYVNASSVPGGPALGNLCSAPVQNPLTGDYEVPLNQNNFYFSGNNLNKDRVAVGVACGTALPSKFNVLLDKTYNTSFNAGNNAGYFVNVNTGVAHNVGVKGEVTAGPGDNTAGFFRAISNGANAANTGVNGLAQNAGVSNTGGRFQAIGGTDAIGVYATASSGSNTTYAAYFSGDVLINGPATGFTNLVLSDQNIKTNIDSIHNALGIIESLKPRQFYFDTLSSTGLNFTSKKQYGLIAQDVELVLPELVGSVTKPEERDSAGVITSPSLTLKNVNYNALFGIMIKAIQEQQVTIDSLRTASKKQDSVNTSVQQQIAALASQINGCCSNGQAKVNNSNNLNQLDVELSDKDAIVLNQNVPNPFAEQTTITYNVPESVSKAQLIFYNSAGQIIQTVDIKTRGKGKVNVFAADLSSGLYHYTLVADGKIVDSKKMLRE